MIENICLVLTKTLKFQSQTLQISMPFHGKTWRQTRYKWVKSLQSHVNRLKEMLKKIRATMTLQLIFRSSLEIGKSRVFMVLERAIREYKISGAHKSVPVQRAVRKFLTLKSTIFTHTSTKRAIQDQNRENQFVRENLSKRTNQSHNHAFSKKIQLFNQKWPITRDQ